MIFHRQPFKSNYASPDLFSSPSPYLNMSPNPNSMYANIEDHSVNYEMAMRPEDYNPVPRPIAKNRPK